MSSLSPKQGRLMTGLQPVKLISKEPKEVALLRTTRSRDRSQEKSQTSELTIGPLTGLSSNMATSPAFLPSLAVGHGHRPIALRPSRCGLDLNASRGGGMAAAAPSRVVTTAKIFDWKKRQDPNYGVVEGLLHPGNLVPAPGSRHRRKRKGRGIAAGQGGSCGFGRKGQKSRSGRSVRIGFEGGQTPLYKRIPKFVGRPMGPGHKKTIYALIKPEHLNACQEGEVVTVEMLKERGIMTKQKRSKLNKVVGGAEVNVKGLTVKAHAFTTSAVKAIESSGGKCVLVSPTTGKDIILEDEEETEALPGDTNDGNEANDKSGESGENEENEEFEEGTSVVEKELASVEN